MGQHSAVSEGASGPRASSRDAGSSAAAASEATAAASRSPVRGPAVSSAMAAYFQTIHDEVERAYVCARRAREKGKDPSREVEILPAEDLAARVEAQVGPLGVAPRIREVTRDLKDREQVSLVVAREVAAGRFGPIRSAEKALDQAVRTGLSILTEGVLVAPLEGIAEVRIARNPDSSTYVDLYFAGPIRAAGGTAQAMSVLIADVVRRELGIGTYLATTPEVERYKEEIPAYKQAVNLQYTPTAAEVERIVRNCPICINGEGTEKAEVTGNRDLERVETNQLRGGACLVIAEGMCLKAPKIAKHVARLGLSGWEFLSDIGAAAKPVTSEKPDEEDLAAVDGEEEAPEEIKKGDKFMRDIIAGRPVFCHPSRPGGFRLRYGRARTAGLASTAIHPAAMTLLDDFIAIGTQLKVERPGKGTIGTPCTALEGPTVELANGDLVPLSSMEAARRARPGVKVIWDLGDILVPFGEFAENNAVLPRSPYVAEWWVQDVERAFAKTGLGTEEAAAEAARWLAREEAGALADTDALQLSRSLRVPLAPSANFLWHDLAPDELRVLSETLLATGRVVEAASLEEEPPDPAAPPAPASGTDAVGPSHRLWVPNEEPVKRALSTLLAHHLARRRGLVVTRAPNALVACLGLAVSDGRIVERPDRALHLARVPGPHESYPIERTVSLLAGVEVRPRAPFRVGARMGRPEKADARMMKPPPHCLFPVGLYGGAQRLIPEAAAKGRIEVEMGVRRCEACGEKTFRLSCLACGGHTNATDTREPTRIDLRAELARAAKAVGETRLPDKIKGVIGTISKDKVAEPLEKGILRAKHQVFTFKDGTVRFDMTDAPLTHFRPAEIGTPVERLRSLGYAHDMHGAPLERDDQVLELKVQDIVLPRAAGEYLLRTARFVDDLLTKFYHVEPFYNAQAPSDLVGHLVAGLAPHTSGAVAVRVIGYTPALVHWGHPYFHAAKRRNCDGDEDAVMLLMDGLLNFSKSYIPDRRGGMMDLPLVLTTRIDPSEIDKEAHNLDVLSRYPLSFYEATLHHAHPKELEKEMGLVASRLETPAQYEGFRYTHDTPDINEGVPISAYKTIGSMMDKLTAQLELATKIRAVDVMDVASRVIGTHFLPDLMGNLKSFSRQTVRCPKCNTKYRRIPLTGKCRTEGCKGDLTLTVHEASVKKYLIPSIEISKRYAVSPYTQQRLALIQKAIESLFQNDKVKTSKLSDFL